MFNYLKPNKTCVLLNKQKIIYESTENGVKPLVKYFYYQGLPSNNTILIDKIVGMAIAHVIIYCNIKTVYTKIISKPALSLLKKNNIDITFKILVENILQRDKTDICPMEKKVLTASSTKEAIDILKQIVIFNNPIHL